MPTAIRPQFAEGGGEMSDTRIPSRGTMIADDEVKQIDRTNASGRTPAVFIHGLWLLPSSWDRWADLFEHAGYSSLTPGWPDDPETVDEANARPDVFANKSVGDIADHFCDVIAKLNKKPAVIGHSFGAYSPR
jgi:pimeloyl-ACP methyl ester carboxylesterase